ncbi:hypothetical protein HII31_02057 [Pseudocercospora fuligena]|uniref:DUF1254 domain-containing protein n=1 Tax=Pseudocercospora fuligena TaxID=685502 RepID=A0A8H6RTQ0_9PEZI|nr:hypothetical protein HII31_02057 [Pseudocercospora fuligena]
MTLSRFLAICCFGLPLAWSLTTPSTVARNATAQNATEFSLVYGYPLLSWANFVGALYEGVGPNVFYHSQYFVSANSPTARNIVAPNQDTLYSAMVVDLTKDNLNITTPDIASDWFHLFSFYDPFGDNWANIGSENPYNKSGSYLLRRSPDPNTYGLHEDPLGQYAAFLDAPQSIGVILVRWLIFNDTSYQQVHEWQNATIIDPTPLPVKDQITGGVGLALAAAKNATSPAESVMKMLAQINSYCPPLVASDKDHVDSQLAAAGIRDFTYTTPPGANLSFANASVPIITNKALSAPGNLINVGNGWNVIAKNASGTYGTHYALRNGIAGPYYLQITEPNAYYPTFDNGSKSGSQISTHFNLSADQAYIYTFSGRPPLSETGFWSLTLYQDQYLVSNPLDRSTLGDRSNLTFPDGKLVYEHGGAATGAADREFQILIQPADVAPPYNWTSNWLPGPAGGGQDVSVLLRFYDACDGVFNGTYEYPKVSVQSVVRNGSSVTSTANANASKSATPTASKPLMPRKVSTCGKL